MLLCPVVLYVLTAIRGVWLALAVAFAVLVAVGVLVLARSAGLVVREYFEGVTLSLFFFALVVLIVMLRVRVSAVCASLGLAIAVLRGLRVVVGAAATFVRADVFVLVVRVTLLVRVGVLGDCS